MDSVVELLLTGLMILFGGYMLFLAGAAIIEYPEQIAAAVAFIVGVILINVFTLWASIAIFAGTLTYFYLNRGVESESESELSTSVLVYKAAGATVAIVICAVVLNEVLQTLAESSNDAPCTSMFPLC